MRYITSYIVTVVLLICITAICYFFTDAIKIGLIIFVVLFLFIVFPEIKLTYKEYKKQKAQKAQKIKKKSKSKKAK
jgi:ABC-type multidrug transport system fused ATPase/permease subunit